MFRGFDVSRLRRFQLDVKCSVAGGVVATAPEFFTGVDAFLGDTLNHGLTA